MEGAYFEKLQPFRETNHEDNWIRQKYKKTESLFTLVETLIIKSIKWIWKMFVKKIRKRRRSPN